MNLQKSVQFKYLFFMFGLSLLLVSCRCKQQTITQFEPVYIQAKDSIHTEYIETVRIDTIEIEIPIPMQSAMQTVRDSVSYLETDLAESTAWINTDGTLGHLLKNKPGSFHSETYVPTTEKNGSKTEYVYQEVPVKVPYAVEVEKKLSAWQEFRLKAFWFLSGALLLAGLWIFRKRIISLF